MEMHGGWLLLSQNGIHKNENTYEPLIHYLFKVQKEDNGYWFITKYMMTSSWEMVVWMESSSWIVLKTSRFRMMSSYCSTIYGNNMILVIVWSIYKVFASDWKAELRRRNCVTGKGANIRSLRHSMGYKGGQESVRREKLYGWRIAFMECVIKKQERQKRGNAGPWHVSHIEWLLEWVVCFCFFGLFWYALWSLEHEWYFPVKNGKEIISIIGRMSLLIKMILLEILLYMVR